MDKYQRPISPPRPHYLVSPPVSIDMNEGRTDAHRFIIGIFCIHLKVILLYMVLGKGWFLARIGKVCGHEW